MRRRSTANRSCGRALAAMVRLGDRPLPFRREEKVASTVAPFTRLLLLLQQKRPVARGALDPGSSPRTDDQRQTGR
jgi:hypothetical protein